MTVTLFKQSLNFYCHGKIYSNLIGEIFEIMKTLISW